MTCQLYCVVCLDVFGVFSDSVEYYYAFQPDLLSWLIFSVGEFNFVAFKKCCPVLQHKHQNYF